MPGAVVDFGNSESVNTFMKGLTIDHMTGPACNIAMMGAGLAVASAPGAAIGILSSFAVCPALKWGLKRASEKNGKQAAAGSAVSQRHKTVHDTVTKHQKRFVPKCQADKIFAKCRELSKTELSEKEVRSLASACQYADLPLTAKSINGAVNRMRKIKSA